MTSSSFVYNQDTIQEIMIQVILACFPGLIALTYFFGNGVIIQIIIACITALLSEGAVLILRHQPLISKLSDGSAILTALLLALSLPPLSPWWMIILATAFAIIIAKQLYGGLGQNPFNPAMVGYVVLLISFPAQMASWLPNQNLLVYPLSFTESMEIIFKGITTKGLTVDQLKATIDGTTQATPLNALKTTLLHTNTLNVTKHYYYPQINTGWAWINTSFFIGGIYLIYKRIITWHIPISFIITILVVSAFSHWFAPTINASPLIHLFSGATMLGAFFVATDPVTSATTIRGKLIFGILTGLLVWLIRSYGDYSDGVAFAVLLSNICVPLIDHYTQPRTYGH